MDLRRNRLDGGLTGAPGAPTPDKYGKKYARDAIIAPAPQLFRPRAWLTFAPKNIFNGLFRVPVNEKILALNSI
jgi:hypothetical protein